jgi:hypothetical protein
MFSESEGAGITEDSMMIASHCGSARHFDSAWLSVKLPEICQYLCGPRQNTDEHMFLIASVN